MSLETIWGSGRDLSAHQMAIRGLITFFVALALVRISGRRSFARRSAFDNIIVIILGTVLGRPIYGASPFWPTVAASTVLVVVHRIIGVATARWPVLERIAKGRYHVLWKDGRLERGALLRNEISAAELYSAARVQLHRDDLESLAEIRVETSGELSLVRRKDDSRHTTTPVRHRGRRSAVGDRR